MTTTNTVRKRANGKRTPFANTVSVRELSVRTATEHEAAIAGMTRADQAAYACTVLPPAAGPKDIIAWLNEHGASIPASGAANMRNHISRWRKAHGRDTEGNLLPLDDARLAELDAVNQRDEHPSEHPATPVREHQANTANTATPPVAPSEHHSEQSRPEVATANIVREQSPAPVDEHANSEQSTNEHRSEQRGEHDDKGPRALLVAFYSVFATLALWGQSDGMLRWLGLASSESLDGWAKRLFAVGAGAALELLAAVLLVFADWRTVRKHERAYAVRALAWAVGLFVVFLNWEAHDGKTRYFFAGVSLTAFLVLVLHSNARRRDALRALGRMDPPSQTYSALQWAMHPVITWQARTAALADPKLSLRGSIEHVYAERARVEAEAQAARRRAALDTLIRQWFMRQYGGDKLRTEIEATRYDLDDVARGLSGRADHDALIAAIEAELLTTNTVREQSPAPVDEHPVNV